MRPAPESRADCRRDSTRATMPRVREIELGNRADRKLKAGIRPDRVVRLRPPFITTQRTTAGSGAPGRAPGGVRGAIPAEARPAVFEAPERNVGIGKSGRVRRRGGGSDRQGYVNFGA